MTRAIIIDDPSIAEKRVKSLRLVKFLDHHVITPRALQRARMSHHSGGGMAQ